MKYFLTIPLVLLFLMGCHKDQSELEKLPPATNSGANTFGCLIEGKAWTANTRDAFLSIRNEKLSAGILVKNDTLRFNLFASRRNEAEGPDGNIYLHIQGAPNARQFQLADGGPYRSTTTTSPVLVILSDPGLLNREEPFITDSQFTGQLMITHLDTTSGKKVISGTFYFTARSTTRDSIIHVTDGRFDIPLP